MTDRCNCKQRCKNQAHCSAVSGLRSCCCTGVRSQHRSWLHQCSISSGWPHLGHWNQGFHSSSLGAQANKGKLASSFRSSRWIMSRSCLSKCQLLARPSDTDIPLNATEALDSFEPLWDEGHAKRSRRDCCRSWPLFPHSKGGGALYQLLGERLLPGHHRRRRSQDLGLEEAGRTSRASHPQERPTSQVLTIPEITWLSVAVPWKCTA